MSDQISKFANDLSNTLPQYAFDILSKMFLEAKTIRVVSEFTRGRGVSRVFLVATSMKNSTESLDVIKIAPASRITREWEAYQSCMPKGLRGITPIKGEPIYLSDAFWGGLRYPLVGNQEYKVESFYEYFQHASAKDIVDDILNDELLVNLHTIWGNGKIETDLRLSDVCGHLLPAYLFVKEEPISDSQDYYELNAKELTDTQVSIGDRVKLMGFQVIAINGEKNSLTLRI